MSANGFPLFIPLLLCLIGFHGLFFYGNLAKKTAAWALFQAGLVCFFYEVTSSAGPVPVALSLEAGAAGLAVSILLGVFCVSLWRNHKTLDCVEISKKVSK